MVCFPYVGNREGHRLCGCTLVGSREGHSALQLYFGGGVSSRPPVSPPPNLNPPAPAPGSLALSSKGWNSAVCIHACDIAQLMCT